MPGRGRYSSVVPCEPVPRTPGPQLQLFCLADFRATTCREQSCTSAFLSRGSLLAQDENRPYETVASSGHTNVLRGGRNSLNISRSDASLGPNPLYSDRLGGITPWRGGFAFYCFGHGMN
jgi:hypothetical protein